MEIESQIQQNIQNNNFVETSSVEDVALYLPSSVERKRALMMYFLFGIMIVISDKKSNVFEYFHFKQAVGWWVSFVFVFVFSLFLFLFPIVRYLGLIAVMSSIIIFILFVRQARSGKHYQDLKGYSLSIFPSLGGWLIGLFEITIDTSR